MIRLQDEKKCRMSLAGRSGWRIRRDGQPECVCGLLMWRTGETTCSSRRVQSIAILDTAVTVSKLHFTWSRPFRKARFKTLATIHKCPISVSKWKYQISTSLSAFLIAIVSYHLVNLICEARDLSSLDYLIADWLT